MFPTMVCSKRCSEQSASTGIWFAILSFKITCSQPLPGETQCGHSYEGSPATGLRINHAQLLGSHNSYHLASTGFNYSHPALDRQLDLGIRALEIDVFYDFVSKVLRVLHVPGLDENSNCETLNDCLTLVRSWSDSNPWHFPLFIQLEMMGGLVNSTISGTPCSTDDVDSASIQCAIDNCVGLPISETENCLLSNCIVQLLSLFNSNEDCAGLVPCLRDQNVRYNSSDPLTETILMDNLAICVSAPPGDLSPIDLNSSFAVEVTDHLISVIDSTFDVSKRITPNDVFSDITEEIAMQQYPQQNFWPEVETSRGKVIFYLRFATWSDSVSGRSRRPFFLHGVDMAVSIANDPADMQHVASPAIVRTRTDAELRLSQSRRQAALDSSAFVVSTDFFPNVSHTQWSSQDSSTRVWLPNGSPVRCNPRTVLPGDPVCTSLLLEDPVALKCRTTTTTGEDQVSAATNIVLRPIAIICIVLECLWYAQATALMW